MSIDLKVFAKECHFVKGVVDLGSIPKEFSANGLAFNEIAFWGRSNVGKSSLINGLLNRKKLVRVSNTPGRTREINFFNLAGEFHIVDLPGYGYARISRDKKVMWNEVVVEYLRVSGNLRRVYLLIDGKVGFKDIDFEIMDFLNSVGRSYQIVLTKVDKSNKSHLVQLEDQLKRVVEENPACYAEYAITSTRDKMGLDNLQKQIVKLLEY